MTDAVQSSDTQPRDGIRIDTSSRIAYRGGHALVLGRDELVALQAFLAAGGKVVSFEALSHTLWPDRPVDMHNIRNVIYRLRRKLRSSHGFEAIVGEGYRLIRLT